MCGKCRFVKFPNVSWILRAVFCFQRSNVEKKNLIVGPSSWCSFCYILRSSERVGKKGFLFLFCLESNRSMLVKGILWGSWAGEGLRELGETSTTSSLSVLANYS